MENFFGKKNYGKQILRKANIMNNCLPIQLTTEIKWKIS